MRTIILSSCFIVSTIVCMESSKDVLSRLPGNSLVKRICNKVPDQSGCRRLRSMLFCVCYKASNEAVAVIRKRAKNGLIDAETANIFAAHSYCANGAHRWDEPVNGMPYQRIESAVSDLLRENATQSEVASEVMLLIQTFQSLNEQQASQKNK